MDFETLCEERTILLGSAIGRVIRPGDVVLLRGDLGSGKTRIAKGIVSAATGAKEDDVVSPTFTLVNTFEGSFPVHHADFYRLRSEDVDELGLDEAVLDGALVVEWPENGPEMWDDPLVVLIERGGQPDRRIITITWSPDGQWVKRMEAFAPLCSFGSTTPASTCEIDHVRT